MDVQSRRRPRRGSSGLQARYSGATVFGSGFAVLIGTGDPPQTTTDVEYLESSLVTRAGYDRARVRALQDASADDVRRGLDALLALERDATAIFYYSGHGAYREAAGTRHYFLCPRGYDPEQHRSTSLCGEELGSRLEQVKARSLFVFFDCCHAGGQFPDDATTKRASAPSPVKTRLEGAPGRLVMSSCTDSQQSYCDHELSHFTRCLVDALCGDRVAVNHDGSIGILDAVLHVIKSVPELRSDQHPVLCNVKSLGNPTISRPQRSSLSPRKPLLPRGDSQGNLLKWEHVAKALEKELCKRQARVEQLKTPRPNELVEHMLDREEAVAAFERRMTELEVELTSLGARRS